MSERCRGTTKAGNPCRTTHGLSADGLCLPHDPARQEAMRESARNGGLVSGAVRRAESLARKKAQADRLKALGLPKAPTDFEDASRALALLYEVGASGQLEPERVRECVGALKAFQAGVEKRDLTRKLRAYTKVVQAVNGCTTCGPVVAQLLREGKS